MTGTGGNVVFPVAAAAAVGWVLLFFVLLVIPPLTPYEQRVVTHVARRAGARGEVPAPVLSDGFEDGEAGFMAAFRGEVKADAVQRELIRPRLGGRRIVLLCLVLLVPAGALAFALTGVHQRDPAVIAGWCWSGVSLVTIAVGVRRVPSAAGRAVLDRWHAAADDGRRATAWDLTVESGLYGQLVPGALVHARVGLWKPRQTTIWLVKPAGVAGPLADPGVPFGPRASS
jgi:hypothetical protein